MSEAPAGGAAPAPTVETADGAAPGRTLTAEELAASARLHAEEAAAFADAAQQQLDDFRAHAAGGIAGLESALDAARQAAGEAARRADEAEAAAGINPRGSE